MKTNYGKLKTIPTTSAREARIEKFLASCKSDRTPSVTSDAEKASIARDAVLHGGTPAPEYQTRPDAWEIECEEENA